VQDVREVVMRSPTKPWTLLWEPRKRRAQLERDAAAQDAEARSAAFARLSAQGQTLRDPSMTRGRGPRAIRDRELAEFSRPDPPVSSSPVVPAYPRGGMAGEASRTWQLTPERWPGTGLGVLSSVTTGGTPAHPPRLSRFRKSLP
jgi:hypothetical protein